MRHVALTIVVTFCFGTVFAHPGHGGAPLHWHGNETLLVLLVAVILGVLLTRR